MDSPVSQLQAILGSISAEQARKLLDDSGGSIETAVAIHFSNGTTGPGPSTLQSSTTEEELAAITGLPPGSRALKRLLRSAHGSLQQAVDMYLAEPDSYNDPGGQGAPVTIGTTWLSMQ
jgi:hypothetical protein